MKEMADIFAHSIFECIFMQKKSYMLIRISLKFVAKDPMSFVNNTSNSVDRDGHIYLYSSTGHKDWWEQSKIIETTNFDMKDHIENIHRMSWQMNMLYRKYVGVQRSLCVVC